MSHKLYKGSQATMRQGGTGSDDYLFRVNKPGQRWFKVTVKGQVDLGALQRILQNCEKVHWHESARYLQQHPNTPTLSATAFLDRFQG